MPLLDLSQNIAHMDLSRLVAVAVLLGALRSVKSLHVRPVVLVPGYGSNLLEAQLTAAYVPPAPGCGARKGNGWFRLWPINQTAMRDPRQVPCFVDQMSLVYDAVSGDYGNAAGVVTRVPFFGSTRGLNGWDPLVRQLEAAGYRDGESLFAVPYDFRYSVAPRGHPSPEGACNFDEFTRLVERASSLGQGRPVVVVAHSFGCALTYQFLLRRPLAWRRRFVKRVVLVASALGGFSEGMNDLAAGTDYGLPNVARPSRVRLARSQQSALWRLPTPTVFGDRPLVVTINMTYTAHNIAEFFEAVGFPEGVRPYVTRVLPAWEALPAPMVPVTSIIGVGVSTPETFVYGGEDGFVGTPEVVYGDGDGDINMVSLVAIEEWSSVEGQALEVLRLPGVRHDGFFSVGFALEKVVAEILKAGSTTVQLHPNIGRVQIDAAMQVPSGRKGDGPTRGYSIGGSWCNNHRISTRRARWPYFRRKWPTARQHAPHSLYTGETIRSHQHEAVHPISFHDKQQLCQLLKIVEGQIQLVQVMTTAKNWLHFEHSGEPRDYVSSVASVGARTMYVRQQYRCTLSRNYGPCSVLKNYLQKHHQCPLPLMKKMCALFLIRQWMAQAILASYNFMRGS